MEWAVGKTGEIFNADAGKLMLPGSKIRWEIHMFAIGQEIKDNQVELGDLLLSEGRRAEAPDGAAHVRREPRVGARHSAELDGDDAELLRDAGAGAHREFPAAHAHARQGDVDGGHLSRRPQRELLSAVNNFQWNWHVNYIYADDAAPLLPKGTMLVFTAWHDNTAANPNNPDPNQWVGWGDRTVDEMAHAWVDVTYLDQAEFDKLVAERKAKKATPMRMTPSPK